MDKNRKLYFDGLACDGVDWSRRPHLELVEDHVSQSLVIDDANVDIRCELLTGYTRIHGLVAIIIVSRGQELLAEVFYCGIFLGKPNRRKIKISGIQQST